MALLIERPIAAQRVACIGLWRNSIVSILLLNVVQDFIGSISFICQDGRIRNIKMRQHIYSNRCIMDIPACQLEVKRISKTIHNNVNFRRLSATACGDELMIFAVYSPFLAPAL